jgi:hypothetical protein
MHTVGYIKQAIQMAQKEDVDAGETCRNLDGDFMTYLAPTPCQPKTNYIWMIYPAEDEGKYIN